MSPATVLLVEDDESDVLFLKRAFRKAGLPHRLEIVTNGREAIEYLSGADRYADRQKHPVPSHVLLDLKLPEKSGFEVLEWIRNDTGLQNLHVSILTSSSESADIQKAKLLRADCYLVKPMSFNGLLEIVASLDEWIRTGRIPTAAHWPAAGPVQTPG
jgi:CheY-like chemotaxis protein